MPAGLQNSPFRRHASRWVVMLALLWIALAGPRAQAHTASTAFLQLSESDQVITAQLELPLLDLDDLLGLDANDDGRLTWGELKARHADLAQYVASHFQLAAGDRPLALQSVGNLVSQRNGEGCAVLRFRTPAPDGAVPLQLRYQLFFERDPQHRCLVRWVEDARARNCEATATILAPDRINLSFTRGGRPPSTFVTFIREGVHHIWSGYDHLFFLLALLLPAVLLRTNAGWAPRSTFRGALTDVLKVVTAFTVAHSFTLALAAFEIVRLPSRLVESTIAASIIVAALANLWPMGRRAPGAADLPVGSVRHCWLVPWKVALVFGLIHGFGFAGVLGELGLQRRQLATSLLGFNAGVELGQLACIAGFLPLAFLLRSTRFYRSGVLPIGSCAIIVLAIGWLVERASGLGFMPI